MDCQREKGEGVSGLRREEKKEKRLVRLFIERNNDKTRRYGQSGESSNEAKQEKRCVLVY